jgi:hypothetical protein
MKHRFFKVSCVCLVLLYLFTSVRAKDDDFGSVVKLIERYYKVKHQSIPLLAKAGIKTATTIARIKGGTAKRIAEAGSIKIAIFEDQSFASKNEFTEFRTSLNAQLAQSWTPFIQTLSPGQKEQTYIFLRENGSKFNVLLVTIDSVDAVVVQVTVSPANLALLLKDPEGTTKAITEEATIDDPE